MYVQEYKIFSSYLYIHVHVYCKCLYIFVFCIFAHSVRN